jgi:imidazoleglycerol-phosphate dehydratase
MKEKVIKERETEEVKVKVALQVEGEGECKINTGSPFFDHMMHLLGKHALFNLQIEASAKIGGLHHLVEEVGICFGEAFCEALEGKEGLLRYGCFCLPMDEVLVRVCVDLSSRPYLSYNVTYAHPEVEGFSTELIRVFLQAFANAAHITLHVHLLSGEDTHHVAEALFKGLGKVLLSSTRRSERIKGPLSTKGRL